MQFLSNSLVTSRCLCPLAYSRMMTYPSLFIGARTSLNLDIDVTLLHPIIDGNIALELGFKFTDHNKEG